jgi:hypothetical protein
MSYKHKSARKAHDANNAVIAAAQQSALKHGVVMAIAVYGTVQGSGKAIVGVDYSHGAPIGELSRLMSLGAGALNKEVLRRAAEALDRESAAAFSGGESVSAELLDRERTGEEDMGNPKAWVPEDGERGK